MENNEDEPDDVKKATPVESAISDGNKDENKESIKGLIKKSAYVNKNDNQIPENIVEKQRYDEEERDKLYVQQIRFNEVQLRLVSLYFGVMHFNLPRRKPKSASAALNDREDLRRRRCNMYKGKFPAQPAVAKNKKPCHPKAEIICRDNLTKDEYIDVLSTPKKSRGLSCKQPKFESTDSSGRRPASGRKPSCKEKAALPRPMSQRLEELAKPKPSHVIDLLQTWGSRLRPEIIDSVQKSLEENCAMSPEQMEAYYNEKDREECNRDRRVRRKKCPAEKGKKKSACDDQMDPEAVCEEYAMAQRFMRHIISHLKNCPFVPEDHYDLTEVILSQLGNVLDYRPSGDGDRKFQMMFLLANGIACWVHGLNVAIAEKVSKQQSQDAKEDIETEESEDEDKDEEEQIAEATEGEEEEEEEGEGEDKEEMVEEVTATAEGDKEGDGGTEEEKNDEETEEIEEIKIEPNEDDTSPETENAIEDSNEVAAEPPEEDEVVDTDEEINVEVENKEEDVPQENEGDKQSVELFEGEREIEPEMEEEVVEESEIEEVNEVEDETIEEIATEEETIEIIPSIKSMVEPGLAIQGLGEGDLFASEIPFITFGKIMEIVVKFLDRFEEAETTEVRRRLQNAILKKLTDLILAEAPDALDNKMKAVLEVLAENIAVFMEDTLPKSKVNEVQTMTPEIESTEVRNWSHWLETVMDNATNWGKWIHEKVGEAEEKARTKVTRGDWQEWTSSVDSEALRWRMFNLDTKHRMHNADLNLTHKKVVHRGGKRTKNVMGSTTLAPYPEKDETEINAYDLSTEPTSRDDNPQITEYEYTDN